MTRICSLWSTENVQWSNSNWTWGECQLVQDICFVWGNAGVLWKDASWKWSECSGSITPVPPIIPVVDIVGMRLGVDAETLIQPWQLEEPWNPYQKISSEKKKRLIKLICKVKGQEYTEEKEISSFPVTVGDIRMVVKAVANIDLDLKLKE